MLMPAHAPGSAVSALESESALLPALAGHRPGAA